MKKVLIVTPNWPPISCPDMHRVRMALPFFEEFGWEPLILKVDPDEQEGIKDPQLAATIPPTVKVWQAGCISKRWTGWFGLNNVGLRSFVHLAFLGSKIIREEKPVMVFFSTAIFPLMVLGRYWIWRHSIPYLLDFQDPWVSDYPDRMAPLYRTWKYRISQLIARLLEPFALRRAGHLICVSPGYPMMLQKRHAFLSGCICSVLPFGAAESDFLVARNLGIIQDHFKPSDGYKHWVYVGCAGKIMELSLRSFFMAMKTAQVNHPEVYANIRLHFIGTDYAPADRARKSVEPIAIECGVSDLIVEETDRVPYFEALKCLLDADALIVPGSDDPGYTASKIYPYLLARKPLLAIFHERSSVVQVIKETGGGTVVTFASGESVEAVAGRIGSAWFDRGQLTAPATNWVAFEPYSARQMTRRLCACFDTCLGGTACQQ